MVGRIVRGRREKSEDTLRVTESTCLSPLCPPHPRPEWPHLCSRATRKSLSSLPRNPLAKGLFSIFSCVICQETTYHRIAGEEDWAGLWPSAPTPGTFTTHGRVWGSCRSRAGSSLASSFTPGWSLALNHSTCCRPSNFVSCSHCAKFLILLPWVPVTASCPCHPCPVQLPHQVLSECSKCKSNSITLLPEICPGLWPFLTDPHPPQQFQCAQCRKHPEKGSRGKDRQAGIQRQFGWAREGSSGVESSRDTPSDHRLQMVQSPCSHKTDGTPGLLSPFPPLLSAGPESNF